MNHADVGINQTSTLENARTLFSFATECSVCKGIADMVETVAGKVLLSALVESVGRFTYDGNQYTQTLRHNLCKLLNIVSEEVCGPCKIYRSHLVSLKKKVTYQKRQDQAHVQRCLPCLVNNR